MSIAYEDREAKEKWLLRPFEWAGHVGLYTSVALIGLWTEPRPLSWFADFIAIGAFTSLIVIQGLIIWGIRRILSVARRL
jgi:hypothetical protein